MSDLCLPLIFGDWVPDGNPGLVFDPLSLVYSKSMNPWAEMLMKAHPTEPCHIWKCMNVGRRRKCPREATCQ
jgi:hypothetical protein